MDYNLKIIRGAAERWQLHRQETERNAAKIEKGEISDVEPSHRINARLERLRVNAAREPSRAAEVATAAAEAGLPGIPGASSHLIDRIGLERVIGKSDFLNVSFLELALAVSRFVGRINIKISKTQSVGFGTGFMVSPRLLLTNNHVIGTKQDAVHSEVEFDYQYDRFGRLLPVVNYALEPNTFFITNERLDFTLVGVAAQSVDKKVELRSYGWNRLIEQEGKALIGDSLNIIQHPLGEAKQISLRSNRLLNLLPDFAQYETDTEPGSSGSPVYNDQWEVIALHHSGVPATDANGNLLDVDDNIWHDGDDPDRLKWVANEGVRISRIVNDIKSRNLTTAEADLRRDMLELEPPHPVVAAIKAEEDARKRGQVPVDLPPHGFATGPGTVSFTVPLTISVQLGAPQSQLNVAVASQAPVEPLTQSAAPPGAGDQGPAKATPDDSVEDMPEFKEALAELEAAATRPYYDQAADEAARDQYYGSLPAGGTLDGEQMFRALHDLLADTHGTKLNYKPAVHVYPWVDLRESGSQLKIRSIYSGNEFNPIELIEADFRVERARLRLRETLMRESSFSAMERERQLALLEASLPFNCEHVVPSRGSQKGNRCAATCIICSRARWDATASEAIFPTSISQTLARRSVTRAVNAKGTSSSRRRGREPRLGQLFTSYSVTRVR